MKRDAELVCRIDVTALLAVILVLLFWFEVTTPPAHSYLNTSRLGEAKTSVPLPGALQDDALWVAVSRDGNVYLRSEKISFDALREAIEQRTRADPKGTVYLAVDSRSRYANVKAALDVIQPAGAQQVSLLTK